MSAVYWLAALTGWPLLLFILFAGGHGDADFGLDTDVDLGADMDADVHSGDLDAAHGGFFGAILSFFSLRAIVFFLALFGLTGILLEAIDTGSLATLLAAVGVGFFAMWFNRTVISYLLRSDSDSKVFDNEMTGSPATVVVQISPEKRGRIAVEVSEQRIYLVARPYRPNDDLVFEKGDRVVIVEIENGTAAVAPMELFG